LVQRIGPSTELKRAGLTHSNAHAAIRLSKLHPDSMREIESRERIPSPTTVTSKAGDGNLQQLLSMLHAISRRCEMVSPGDFLEYASRPKTVSLAGREIDAIRRWHLAVFQDSETVDDWLAIIQERMKKS
jgi:hypothetical protein